MSLAPSLLLAKIIAIRIMYILCVLYTLNFLLIFDQNCEKSPKLMEFTSHDKVVFRAKNIFLPVDCNLYA